MSNNKEENLKLYIPIGISTRMDFIPGFGKNELIQALVGIAIGIGVAIVAFIITNQSLSIVVTMILAIGGSILATTKNSINISIVDYINDIMKFSKERQVYPYRQAKP